MGRLIRVVIYASVVLILYFWLTSLWKTYKQNQENTPIPVTQVQDTVLLSSDTSDWTSDEDIISDNDIVSGDQFYNKLDKAIEKISDNETKPSKIESPPPVVEKTVPVEKKRNETIAKIGTPGGLFMVIAGSFIKVENAQSQLKKLKSLGYSNAEIKIFISSEYHSVIVSRHASQGEADRVVQDLQKNGIESFIKTKQ